MDSGKVCHGYYEIEEQTRGKKGWGGIRVGIGENQEPIFGTTKRKTVLTGSERFECLKARRFYRSS